jgi:hypothetical protein
MNASFLQAAGQELSLGVKFRNAAMITATELKDLANRNGLRFLSSPLFHFRQIPGLNNGVVATISRAGRKALAEASLTGASRLATLVRYAGPALSVAGKAFAAPVDLGVETAFHMNDAHCGGEVGTKYADLVMTENAEGHASCQPFNGRTSKTDDFIFGLSPDDQLKEVRENPASCRMLTQLYARYAPSQNWELTCSSGAAGPTARLNGKNAKGDGQMVSFNASDRNTLENLEWYSSSFERCAKVNMKDDAFESAQIFKMKTGMPSCGSVGEATSLGKAALTNRTNHSDEKKMVQEFSAWQTSNSSVLGMAVECCSGAGDNSLCPKASAASGRPAGRPARTGSTRH